MNALKQSAAALAVLLPLLAVAQTAEPAKPEPAAPAAEPAAPAEPAKPVEPAKPKEEGVKLTWYGFVLANAYFNSASFNARDFPGAVTRDITGAGGAVLFSARQSRFGIRLAMKDETWTKADVQGVAEFDFKGGTNATTTSSTWNVQILRMRVANLTATWKLGQGSFSLLGGQAAGLVNQLTPESVTYIGDQMFWQSGNLWRRSPMFRAGYALKLDAVALELQAAAVSPADSPPAGSVPSTDSTSSGAADFGAGNRSRTPELEGRFQLTVKPTPDVNAVVAVSGNSAKRRYDQGVNQKDLQASVFGAEADISVKYVEVKGEYYASKGEEDSYNGFTATVVGAAGNRQLVKSTGYWAQLILKPIPQVWLTGGFARAKGKTADLNLVSATSSAATRAGNTMKEVGVLGNLSKSWRCGVEYVLAETEWLGTVSGTPAVRAANVKRKANQLSVSTQLKF